MASASIFALIDDIASFTKDIAAISKLAMKKTAGVMGDDLAVNAEQVNGVAAKRELPVVWAVFKGSMINKIIIVPLALLISFFLPALMTPLLMIGGAFLAYEGTEAVIEKFFHKDEAHARNENHINAAKDDSIDLVQYEQEKIKNAIKTDFILSAEIIAIALSTMEQQSILHKIVGLSLIAVLVTTLVYGFVAVLIRMDDVGFFLMKKDNALGKKIGQGLISSVPHIMTALGYIGMIAMFLVGGGILLHGVPVLAHAIEAFFVSMGGGWIKTVGVTLSEAVIALIVGSILVVAHHTYAKMRPQKTQA